VVLVCVWVLVVVKVILMGLTLMQCLELFGVLVGVVVVVAVAVKLLLESGKRLRLQLYYYHFHYTLL
jgi:hypothetical protein